MGKREFTQKEYAFLLTSLSRYDGWKGCVKTPREDSPPCLVCHHASFRDCTYNWRDCAGFRAWANSGRHVRMDDPRIGRNKKSIFMQDEDEEEGG